MSPNKLIFSATHQQIILVLVALGLNLNTLFHDYALDDCVVLTQNTLVQKGIKGIPKLLTTDYVYGYSTKENILSGARYRPLSLILFAVEYQFFGANPFISHLITVLLFASLIVLLYKLLKNYLFPQQHYLFAFITCLLFAVHPIHTEVIANVKSRDEIITFIFLILSLISLIKYIDFKKTGHLFLSLLYFLLALLTKETAVTYIAIVPLIIYFFLNQTIKKSLYYSIPFAILFIVYLVLRLAIVGFEKYPVTDVTNAPYLYATASEAFATKVFILFKYLCLLIFPNPLTTDYGYNQIPYITIFSAKFIGSFILLFSMIIYAVYTFKNKSLLSFSILYFFITISPATNFIFDLGAPLAERMLFQPSLAFCIAVAFLFLKAEKKAKLISYGLLSIILILFSIKTIARNNDWKNNETIILADVTTSPDCSRLNLYACEQFIIKANAETNADLKTEYLNKAITYGEKSLKIHSKFAYIYQRLGFAYFNQQNYFKAADLWLQASKLDPDDMETKQWLGNLSNTFYKQGNSFSEQNKTDEAIKCYLKATKLNKNNIEAWYNLGGNYFINKDSANAAKAWDIVKQLDLNFPIKKQDFNHN